MATLKILEEEQKTAQETELINAIYTAITNENGIILSDDIKDNILSFFEANSKRVLQTKGTPFYVLLSSLCALSQAISLSLIDSNKRLLYTQSSGEDLSLTAANFGFTRVEAKKSTMTIILTASKKTIISNNTSFTDGAGNIWLTQGGSITLEKDTPTRISLSARDSGVVNYISPISPTNTIANLVSYEIDTTSIVLGRDQESDAELKSTISGGINVFGSDDGVKRALLENQNVLSAFCYTNYDTNNATSQLGTKVEPNKRFVCVRTSKETLSQEEADLIAQTITTNTIFSGNYQKPESLSVRQYFGISEDLLKKPISEGGAGIENGVSSDSNCILLRQVALYGNFVDVFFYIASSTNIQCKVEVRYIGDYTNTEKENMVGDIKSKISQTIAELSQVGSSILTSDIAERLLTTTDLGDKINIRSILLKRYSDNEAEAESGWGQYLDANSNEFFKVYSTEANIYAGISIQEN